MRRILFLLAAYFLFAQNSFSQTAHVPGPTEQKMADSLCSCVVKLDMSKIKTKQDALNAYTNCVGQHADILIALADERKVDIGDHDAMLKVGVDLAMNLMKQNCKGFSQLAVIMGQKESNDGESLKTVYGNFKRIETKGFNYLIISDDEHKETSLLWLRQFPGSEKFINGGTNFTGKKISRKYREMEIYLPQAKGYYKVKEIIELTVE
jgi:hypothetical protein